MKMIELFEWKIIAEPTSIKWTNTSTHGFVKGFFHNLEIFKNLFKIMFHILKGKIVRIFSFYQIFSFKNIFEIFCQGSFVRLKKCDIWNFARSPNVACKDICTRKHRFNHGCRQSFLQAWIHKNINIWIKIFQNPMIIFCSQKLYAIIDLKIFREISPFSSHFSFSDNFQLPRIFFEIFE